MNNLNLSGWRLIGIRRLFLTFVCFFWFVVFASQATNRYVVLAWTSPVSPFTNWATAATNIQDAITASSAGDTVLVSNGLYEAGGLLYGSITNRVVINKAITVCSANNDPVNTIIKGAWDPTSDTNGLGPASVRCVYMVDGSTLIGFTLTNGASAIYPAVGWWLDYHRGGGVWCQSTNATVSNCVITVNSAWGDGGGAYRGTFYNCTFDANLAYYYGGGINASVVYNSNFRNNRATASSGGATYQSTLYNCIFTSNTASWRGGVARGSILYNCTMVTNSASEGGGVYAGSNYNCISWGNNKVDVGTVAYYSCGVGDVYTNNNCITNDPQFINSAGGNYRLAKYSPCVNTGTNMNWMAGSVDLDGHHRLDKFSGLPDMGCYEYLPNGTMVTFSDR